MKKEEIDLINKSQVRELGFSEAMIKCLLPRPKERINHFYRNGPTIKLWEKEVVFQVMKTDAYKLEKEKYDKRILASQKALETRAQREEEEIQEILDNITIPKLSKAELYHQIKEYRQYADNFPYDISEFDEKTQQRLIVNLIRHNLIAYDDALEHLKGKMEKYFGYYTLKAGILSKIAFVYPEYRDECRRQINHIINAR